MCSFVSAESCRRDAECQKAFLLPSHSMSALFYRTRKVECVCVAITSGAAGICARAVRQDFLRVSRAAAAALADAPAAGSSQARKRPAADASEC